MRTLSSIKRPPTIRVFTQLSTGKRAYRYGKEPIVTSGPGNPPAGFIVPTVSKTEWMVYWALAKIFKNPENPWQGPWIGGVPDWTYQQPFMRGRAQPLGAIVDFVIWRTPTGRPVGIRVQTERWHIFTSNEKQVSDAFQRARLQEEIDVVDVFDYTFTSDLTGQTVIQVMKAAIGLIEIPDPLRNATARRNARR